MLKGIDISTFQNMIDWNKVRRNGIDFAMIKATQGRAVSSKSYLFIDRRFKTNITGASGTGIRCGVYHYLTAQTVAETQTEAAYFLETLAPYAANVALWAAVDVEEDKYLPADKVLLAAIVNAFCACVTGAGFKPMVYTNPNYLKYRLTDISHWDLWLACWPKIVDADNPPTCYGNIKIWQWGASAVDGITGDVDSDFGYFDVDAFCDASSTAGEMSGETMTTTALNTEEDEENMARYNKLSDIPNDYGFRDIIETLMNAEIINGDGSDKTGNDDVIDLSRDQVRTIVFEYRGGAFDRALIAKGMTPAIEI